MNSTGCSTELRDVRVLEEISRIGLALSAEKDIDVLLELVIDAARTVSNADAGTLYVLDKKENCLRFVVVQNDTTKTRLSTKQGDGASILPPIPLSIGGSPNNTNVSSYVALTGSLVNIPDVYDAAEFNFTGPRRYDEQTGYRTTSMLVIPMANNEGEVIGVLQLINAKDPETGAVTVFPEREVVYASSVASQAAVAFTNTHLIKKLQSDLAEITDLQNSEKELGRKLRAAYLKTEESNRELSAALKKVQTIRIAATLVALLSLTAVTSYSWNVKLLPEKTKTAAKESTAVHRIQSKPITSAIYLTGSLEPLKVVNLTSPISGKVKEIHFRYGDIVKAGQMFLKLDTSDLEVRRREAKAVYIQASEALLLSLAGGVFGVVLGIGSTYLIAHFAKWSFSISYLAVSGGTALSCLIGVFFGFYPAQQACRLDPIAALRAE